MHLIGCQIDIPNAGRDKQREGLGFLGSAGLRGGIFRSGLVGVINRLIGKNDISTGNVFKSDMPSF